jgi:hypothetical protein
MTANIETTDKPGIVGMNFQPELPFEEWEAIGQRFGEATKRFSWALGDWLVYGAKNYKGRVSAELYEQAEKTTGIDRASLVSLATVCRRIPIEKRLENLSFEHHQAVATIANEDRRESWLEFLRNSQQFPSKKFLKLSISCADDEPRLITKEEYEGRKRKFGSDNYVPHLTRLLTVLRKTLPAMSDYEKTALRADVKELQVILNNL